MAFSIFRDVVQNLLHFKGLTKARGLVFALLAIFIGLLLYSSLRGTTYPPHTGTVDGTGPDRTSEKFSPESEEPKVAGSPVTELPEMAAPRPSDKSRKNLQILDPSALKISQDAVDYLKLSPAQLDAVNHAIGNYRIALFGRELSDAYIAVKATGDEEIVVPAIDRRPILAALKSEVAEVIGSSRADVFEDLIAHDRELGAVNTELRVSIEKGQDGIDRLAYTRHVLSPNAYDPSVLINIYHSKSARPDVPTRISSTMNLTTKSFYKNLVRPRVQFLLDAADSLPRRNQ